MEVGLTTFLRLIQLQPQKQWPAMESLLQPGGYDRYWSLKKTISHKIASKDFDADPGYIADLKNKSELSHNAAALDTFTKWSKPSSREWENADLVGTWYLGEHDFLLKSKPSFITTEKNEAYLHLVYASSTTPLTQSVAGLGCFVLKKMFQNTQFGNCRFCVLDLAKGRRYSDRQVPKNAELMLEHEVAGLSRMARTILAA